ncbi:MAG: aspartate carbamoyltransferase catalytic subunit [Actinobacteria bacterium]|nr:MAG: aspartate carbamoyltransferase catalytic subunit [Actinomycetota bacterium]
MRSQDLLGIEELTREEIELILSTADSFSEIATRTIKKVPTLRGRTIINLFCEPSTRTRTSFELAGKRLSGDVINISGSSSATVKGESLRDTANTIQAMSPDIVVIRHSAAGSAKMLADLMECSVVNAGDGSHEHPTQALLDLFTIRKHLARIEGLHVGIVGDITHSRVARSNILALGKMGARVTVIGPPTLIPKEVEKLGVRVSYDFDGVVGDLDVIYLLRIQKERQGRALLPSLREYSNLFGLSGRRLALAKEDALVMHPGPMNRGVEISGEVAELERSVVTDQVTNGVAVRMAVLYLLLGGGEADGANS